jgi:hypothetical protein
MNDTILDLLRNPLFWFSTVFVGLLVNLAASYVFQYLNVARPHKAFLNVVTVTHAVLTGISWMVVAAIKSHDEPITSMLLLLLAAGVPMGILWLARWSPAASMAQLLTFVAMFGAILISVQGRWLDTIPAYGVLAALSSSLVFIYIEAYHFLTGKDD